jgi:protein gp37
VSTGIEWTDATWNPIRARLRSDPGRVGWHCEHASPGCERCYSETRNLSGRCNLGTKLPFKPGHRKDVEIFLDEATLTKPLHWRKPRMIFVCSMTDLFADFVTDEMIDRVFAVMALCPQHTFQVLTKRSARMREYMTSEIDPPLCGRLQRIQFEAYRIAAASGAKWDEAAGIAARQAVLDNLKRLDPRTNAGFKNVWLGVSVEDQARADERIPDLLATPAAVRWLSCEPLLGPVDLTGIRMQTTHDLGFDALGGREIHKDDGNLSTAGRKLDWIVCGGESGKGARPMHPDWARSLRDQCAAAGVAFFMKQWGEWAIDDQPLPKLRDPALMFQQGRISIYPDGLYRGRGFFPADARNLTHLHRIGKKRAGRLLDGQLHDAMPETARA